MEENAEIVTAGYRQIEESAGYQSDCQGKKIVIVFDNVPAHCQTESRADNDDDFVLLCLAPYSPMCNPIEGSVITQGHDAEPDIT